MKNIFAEGELAENSVYANFAHTAADGKTYQTNFYNLDAIAANGQRVALESRSLRIEFDPEEAAELLSLEGGLTARMLGEALVKN